ncbi:MAG: hypothetical protein NTZ05_11390, partial [Chloroflexi bacterium]|nr:hypothetical protein [Chloroflexota bacterium]
NVLRVVIGGFLLIFGLQWIRKAILRYVGMKALHDEERIFAAEVKALSVAPIAREGMDWQGFTVAFKGVLLEGLEVAFIVITFGANASAEELWGFSGVGLATVAALSAAALVIVAAVIVHRPLAKVPENDMKMAVGLMLVAFGTFWGGEGIGVDWAWGDATILALIGGYGVMSWTAVTLLRKSSAVGAAA